MKRVYCLELRYDSIYYLDPSPSSALNIRIWFWNISVSKTYFFFGFIYILRTTGRNQLLPCTELILFFKKIESRAAIQKWRSRHLDCGTFETLIAALDCDTKLELRQCRSVALRGTGAAMPISAYFLYKVTPSRPWERLRRFKNPLTPHIHRKTKRNTRERGNISKRYHILQTFRRRHATIFSATRLLK